MPRTVMEVDLSSTAPEAAPENSERQWTEEGNT